MGLPGRLRNPPAPRFSVVQDVLLAPTIRAGMTADLRGVGCLDGSTALRKPSTGLLSDWETSNGAATGSSGPTGSDEVCPSEWSQWHTSPPNVPDHQPRRRGPSLRLSIVVGPVLTEYAKDTASLCSPQADRCPGRSPTRGVLRHARLLRTSGCCESPVRDRHAISTISRAPRPPAWSWTGPHSTRTSGAGTTGVLIELSSAEGCDHMLPVEADPRALSWSGLSLRADGHMRS
ncbi:hypothetical protein GMRT_21150 [Giardia muris]|uniref:Uncharacterized protein n=1 Tax=Giardia muris TaxID=5742 RepID=A0A4Z1SWZ3_GIAMU|nr:hypothetical protein GMRT_21144 [Giardia muris]TNJ30322.1 hypothetical protein GMRT_21150 [Giardia muris]|eukprot:TNJ30319.1 hypothetical protein GMRT_21144 [Giardia muris]